MPKSRVDSYRDIDKDNWVVSLISINRERANGFPGKIGFVILEGINAADEQFQLCFGAPFVSNSNNVITATNIQDSNLKALLRSIGFNSSLSLTIASDSINCPNLTECANFEPEMVENFSYKKARHVFCQTFDVSHKIFDEDEDEITQNSDNSSTSWNPFSRLIESRYFPFARLKRSSLWTRITDTFLIIDRLLNYVFPFPMLLEPLLNHNNSVGQYLIQAAYYTSYFIKMPIVAVLTALLSPIVGIIHLIFWLNQPATVTKNLLVKPIKGDVETFEDLTSDNINNFDFSLGTLAYLGSKLMDESQIRENITIKPLAVIANHNSEGQFRNYKTLDAGSPVNTVRDVALGVFNKSTGKPIGIAELSIFNKQKIKDMMELNCCHIDEELEALDITPLMRNYAF